MYYCCDERKTRYLTRVWNVVTGKIRYSADEAARFISFNRTAVEETFKRDPKFAEDPELAGAFLQAVGDSAEHLFKNAAERERVTRRRFIGLGLGLLGAIAAKAVYDTYFTEERRGAAIEVPDKRATDLRYWEEFESEHGLSANPSIPSGQFGWRISYEKKDPNVKFAEDKDSPGVWNKNFEDGGQIIFLSENGSTLHTNIKVKLFKSPDGNYYPQLDVVLYQGLNDHNIEKWILKKPDPDLDTSVVKFE